MLYYRRCGVDRRSQSAQQRTRMNCWPAYTWALDALVVVAIVTNLVCIVKLRRKSREVDKMIDRLQQGRELQLAAIRFWNRHRIALSIPEDE